MDTVLMVMAVYQVIERGFCNLLVNEILFLLTRGINLIIL